MANVSSYSDLSSNPTEAWEQMKPNATVMRFKTRSNPKHSVAKVMNTDVVIGKLGTFVVFTLENWDEQIYGLCLN